MGVAGGSWPAGGRRVRWGPGSGPRGGQGRGTAHERGGRREEAVTRGRVTGGRSAAAAPPARARRGSAAPWGGPSGRRLGGQAEGDEDPSPGMRLRQRTLSGRWNRLGEDRGSAPRCAGPRSRLRRPGRNELLTRPPDGSKRRGTSPPGAAPQVGDAWMSRERTLSLVTHFDTYCRMCTG
jgi:hypothetical protein